MFRTKVTWYLQPSIHQCNVESRSRSASDLWSRRWNGRWNGGLSSTVWATRCRVKHNISPASDNSEKCSRLSCSFRSERNSESGMYKQTDFVDLWTSQHISRIVFSSMQPRTDPSEWGGQPAPLGDFSQNERSRSCLVAPCRTALTRFKNCLLDIFSQSPLRSIAAAGRCRMSVTTIVGLRGCARGISQ